MLRDDRITLHAPFVMNFHAFLLMKEADLGIQKCGWNGRNIALQINVFLIKENVHSHLVPDRKFEGKAGKVEGEKTRGLPRRGWGNGLVDFDGGFEREGGEEGRREGGEREGERGEGRGRGGGKG